MDFNQKISIAMDGPAGAGKSSIARDLADELNFLYVSAGELYRSFTYACLNKGFYVNSEETLLAVLRHLNYKFNVVNTQKGKRLVITLDNQNITPYLHDKNISHFTPKIACYPSVRNYFRQVQKDLARQYNVVMEGRDICSVVLPNANFKFYIDASAEARAIRRCTQLGNLDDYEKVLAEIKQRDKLDTERESCPLQTYNKERQNDVIYIDTSNQTLSESINCVKQEIFLRLPKSNNFKFNKESTQLEM